MKNTDILKITIPGKAFIAGEYLALSGEPAVIAAVEPLFSLMVRWNPYGQNKNPFHAESPAGILWKKHEPFLKEYELIYTDPHLGHGGWGGSTAEFGLLHSFLQQRESLWTQAQPLVDTHLMLREYREIAGRDGGVPSGADLVGQVKGGLTLFDRNHGRILNYAWLFADLGFYLAKTKNKIQTHQHLKNLTVFNQDGLSLAMTKVQHGLLAANAEIFSEGVNNYAHEMSQLGFVHADTTQVLSQINNTSVMAKKGCGALGADVVLIIYQKQNIESHKLAQEIENLGLKLIASEANLSAGVQYQIIPNFIQLETSP